MILLYCTFQSDWRFDYRLALYNPQAAYAELSKDSFISGVVQIELARSNELILLEGVLANILLISLFFPSF